MKQTAPLLYPLRFKEIIREYGFGSRWIVESFQKTGLPKDQRIAETWEVCDRPGESSQVINGPYAGQSLHDIIAQDPSAILGTDVVQRSGERFPLLVKLLDVTYPLGEQAHHNDHLASRRGLPDPGKTEAWVILRTRPGAQIHCGQLNDQVSPEKLKLAILEGTASQLMRPYTVQPGDSFLLYAGTMHYSPGGVLFYEIMQNSDVYISLRKPPEGLSPEEFQVKLDETLEGVHLEPGYDCQTIPIKLNLGVTSRSFLLACNYFAVERLDLHSPYAFVCDGRHFYVLTQIEGSCQILAGNFTQRLDSGMSCLLPADLGEVMLTPLGQCALLVGYVPDLAFDIIKPLQRANISEEAILRLGGRTHLNHIRDVLASSKNQ